MSDWPSRILNLLGTLWKNFKLGIRYLLLISFFHVVLFLIPITQVCLNLSQEICGYVCFVHIYLQYTDCFDSNQLNK